MSRKPSALKAARTASRRRQTNHRREVNVERLLRQFRKADQPSQELNRELQQAIDKAAGRKVIHKRKADRMKSRLAKKLNSAPAKKKA